MSTSTSNSNDQRRPDKVLRYKPFAAGGSSHSDDSMPDYMNVLSMLFSMCGLMMKLKWCAWIAIFCSAISFANSRIQDDTKQIFSSFMLSFSAVIMTYLQNPLPMTLPFSS
ncbi:PREDICTED: protein Asterix-like [Rhagoletis zephyria]|uniref:protein Asterix-like n=1 Tax=Rhagoletis zephyria TaxID=28612 RepID=UPI000811A0C5|nr:PREDICTED: protein Asterix-like [Rhagoletis zephyria]KAH9387662.1 Protein Asterix [Tyrophagus putrescentiae]